jgi:nucleotide-binding universal stress UspA family protein
MFDKILVPLDGSPLAEQALAFAMPLARSVTGQIVLVRALDKWAIHGSQDERAIHEADATAATSLVQSHVAAQGVPASSIVRAGAASAVIEAVCAEENVSLIAMSTHGHGGLHRLAYGSVADQVVRLSSRPLLLIPAHASAEWSPGREPLLVPLDGSPVAELALNPANELANALQCGITLLQVVEPPAVLTSDDAGYNPLVDLDAWADEAKAYVNGVAQRERDGRISVTAKAVIGYAAPTITADASAGSASAIVMVTHGRTGLAGTVLGSVTLGVAHRATVPVLIVRSTP